MAPDLEGMAGRHLAVTGRPAVEDDIEMNAEDHASQLGGCGRRRRGRGTGPRHDGARECRTHAAEPASACPRAGIADEHVELAGHDDIRYVADQLVAEARLRHGAG